MPQAEFENCEGMRPTVHVEFSMPLGIISHICGRIDALIDFDTLAATNWGPIAEP